MANENLVPKAGEELSVEEFSIVELEERLEFLDRCNPNCTCGPQPQQPGDV